MERTYKHILDKVASLAASQVTYVSHEMRITEMVWHRHSKVEDEDETSKEYGLTMCRAAFMPPLWLEAADRARRRRT